MSTQKKYKLEVKDIYRTTEDCVILSFDIPEAFRSYFSFRAGQYLTISKEINGVLIARSYSICTSPYEHVLKIAIKQVPNGKFSNYANQKLKIGDYLEVAPPQGNFCVDIDQDTKRNYVAFAAGSGITPIISIIKTQLEKEPKCNFKLFYVNKRSNSIILKEDLEALKNKYIDRLELFYFLTREQRNIEIFNGRIDKEKLDWVSSNIFDPKVIDHYFSCGPEAMVNLIQEYFGQKGIPKEKLHFELFGTDNSKYLAQIENLTTRHSGKSCEVSITEGGKTFTFNMEQGSDNLLDASATHVPDLPFACKGGVCATCKAKLHEGEVTMPVSYGLEQDEINAGYILTCQAIPTTKSVVVDFDI